MSDYKLTFKLKQHTPIIHFQHDQYGATLRASELKPKLDKFLIKKFEEKGEDYSGFLIKGQEKALNYKVKIKEPSTIKYYLPLPLKLKEERNKNLVTYIEKKINLNIIILAPTPFFANADKIKFLKDNKVDEAKTQIDELRFALFSEREIEGSILTFNSGLKNNNELKEKLKKIIIPFFIATNFGNRQNKGFGSYTVVELDGAPVYEDKKLLKDIFSHYSDNSYALSKSFEFIVDEYQLLKSGKNFPSYMKSELFNYFIDKNIRWEKRYIKQKINTNRILNKELYWDKKCAPVDIEDTTKKVYNDWNDKQKNDYKYIRALLGLAEQFEYTVFAEKKDNNGTWVKLTSPDFNKKYIVTLEHQPKPNEEKIERFQSPIFFKVIDGIVYLGINNSYQNILGEKFEFKLKLKGDNKGTIKSIGTRNVPSAFVLSDFINNHLSSNWKKL